MRCRWLASGVQWISFFQDTNALGTLALPAMLAVSKTLDLQVGTDLFVYFCHYYLA